MQAKTERQLRKPEAQNIYFVTGCHNDTHEVTAAIVIADDTDEAKALFKKRHKNFSTMFSPNLRAIRGVCDLLNNVLVGEPTADDVQVICGKDFVI